MNHLLLILALILLITLLKLAYSIIWVPLRIQSQFSKQGVQGPRYRPIFFGNTKEIIRMFEEVKTKPKSTLVENDVVEYAVPFYRRWSRMYGESFLYWYGTTPRVAISDPDLIKEVLMNTSGSITKIGFNPSNRQLFGQGLAGLEGHKWALHRRIAVQAFTMERVKVFCSIW